MLPAPRPLARFHNNPMNESVSHAFADLIGLEVTASSNGECTTELSADPRHFNPNNVVHGAVIYALADTGMGAALTSLLDEGEICSTIEIKINYFRPGTTGRLRCTTRMINRSRQTAAMDSEVFSEEGKLLARATGTFMIMGARRT